MQINRWLLWVVRLILGIAAVGCATQASRPGAAGTPQAAELAQSEPMKAPPAEVMSPGAAVIAGPAPATQTTDSSNAKAQVDEQALAQPTAPKERPGLATQFGEDLRREARHTQFERESSTSPWVTATIWYNDVAGAEVMAREASSRTGNRAEVELMNGGLVVGVTDEWFQVLPGFIADKRPYAIGEANARYAIRIANRTDFAFEIVASVDGLNVIDGKPASLERRGYVVAPRDTMTIEGFRTSESMIAAFRFGKVSESYSAQMGHGDRNVGVIGVAFFQERGKRPSYPTEDVRLRQDANPFPGEYAPKPPRH